MFSAVPVCPTTIQRYYPNGHSRHSSDSFSFAYRPVYKSLACCRNETGLQGDSSHVSADVGKRSADDDSPSENEDTEDSTDDQQQDDTSTEHTEDYEDDETDTR